MTTRLTKLGYENLIKQDLDWLNAMPPTLEREHCKLVLEQSVALHYPPSNERRLDDFLEWVIGSTQNDLVRFIAPHAMRAIVSLWLQFLEILPARQMTMQATDGCSQESPRR